MSRKNDPFVSAQQLTDLAAQYFMAIDGEYHLEEKETTSAKGQPEHVLQKVWDREPEPATITGLALYLGFSSRQSFEAYESHGEFATALQRARLRVEASYEKKLHYQSPAGAIFALKSLGWHERADNPAPDGANDKIWEVVLVHSGPQLASSEGEIILD